MTLQGMFRAMALAAMLALSGLGGDAPSPSRLVGSTAADFTLKDATTGRDVPLHSFHGKKAAVLVFLGTECPIGNQYLPRLAEIARQYEPKGVVVLGINANAHETAEEVAAHAKEFAIPFPVLKDDGAKVADQLRAERTCEAIVLDESAVIRFRGAIDDQYGFGVRKPQARKHFLTDALDAVLAGKPVATSATRVDGCPIERGDAKAEPLKIAKIRPAAPEIRGATDDALAEPVGAVTFAKDVAGIVQAKCQGCHRPKAAAPFSLLSYDDARRWAASIREVVDDRRMPPWHADPRFGHFENDRRLSARERATLIAWVDQQTPLGDPKDLPAAKTYPEAWVVGTPDVILEMPKGYTVPPDGFVDYQYFRIPTNFTEDRWVQSIECLPGDRSVVHHIIAYLQEKRPKPGSDGPAHLGGYAPGELPCVYNPGIAKLVPAGSEILLQVHYTPDGKVRTDRSRVGLIFAKTPPAHAAITRGIVNERFAIPPGDGHYEVKSKMKFGQDSHLLSFMPHMHLRGKDFKYVVTYPGREPETLLSVPAYDFAWQSYYRLAEPLPMPKGTVIECFAHFDNSDKNPANPDPKATVKWGDQTFEEMMIGYIDYYRDTEPVMHPSGVKAATADGAKRGD